MNNGRLEEHVNPLTEVCRLVDSAHTAVAPDQLIP